MRGNLVLLIRGQVVTSGDWDWKLDYNFWRRWQPSSSSDWFRSDAMR